MPAYLVELIDAKRAAPGEDLLSAMIHAVDEGGDRLSPDELIGMCVLLLVAGHETTVNLIGNGMRALFAHPEQLAALRADFGLLDGAIEEMLRYDGPVETCTERLALEDVEMGGVTIPAGSTVLIAMADADRDPARFEEPRPVRHPQGRPRATSPSATACTTAWGRRWRGWRAASPSARSWSAARTSSPTRTRRG